MYQPGADDVCTSCIAPDVGAEARALDRAEEPDLGSNHLPLPPLTVLQPEPESVRAPAPPRPRPRLAKAPAVVVEVVPVAAPPPPPPVELRWQSVLARMRPDHVWTDLVFRGQ